MTRSTLLMCILLTGTLQQPWQRRRRSWPRLKAEDFMALLPAGHILGMPYGQARQTPAFLSGSRLCSSIFRISQWHLTAIFPNIHRQQTLLQCMNLLSGMKMCLGFQGAHCHQPFRASHQRMLPLPGMLSCQEMLLLLLRKGH